MPKIYTQEGLEEAYRNHIKDYMEENGLYDEIGLDSETAITVLKEKMDENGMLVFRWIDRNNFDANHDYFFFDVYGYLYSSNQPVSENYSLENIEEDFEKWLEQSDYRDKYDKIDDKAE